VSAVLACPSERRQRVVMVRAWHDACHDDPFSHTSENTPEAGIARIGVLSGSSQERVLDCTLYPHIRGVGARQGRGRRVRHDDAARRQRADWRGEVTHHMLTRSTRSSRRNERAIIDERVFRAPRGLGHMTVDILGKVAFRIRINPPIKRFDLRRRIRLAEPAHHLVLSRATYFSVNWMPKVPFPPASSVMWPSPAPRQVAGQPG